MASCSTQSQTDFNARNNANGANGGPRVGGNMGKGAGGFYNWEKAQQRNAQDNAAQAKRVKRTAEFIDPNTVQGPDLTAEQRTRIRGLSGFMQKLWSSAENTANTRLQDFVNAWNYYSGTTASDRSYYADIANALKVRLIDANSTMDYWATKHFGTPGQFASDNKLVGSRQRMTPKLRGTLERYTTILSAIKQAHTADAQRAGMPVEDYLSLVGDYMVARHMPSRNAEILNRWRNELTLEQAKRKPNQKTITTLENKIADLEDNLNNLDVVDLEGNPLPSLESGGMTNAQAAQRMKNILSYLGMTEVDLNPAMARLKAFDQRILQDRVDAGLVSIDTLDAFPTSPEFEATYVPVMRRFDSITGIINDNNLFNPGRYRAFNGMAHTPDSAYWSILQHARKSAAEQSMQEFGTNLVAAARIAMREGRDVGLVERDYDTLMNRKYNGTSAEVRGVQRVEAEGGIVVDVPEFDIEGNSLGTKRRLIQFRPDYIDPVTRKTGHDLNLALSDNVKIANGWSPLRKLTSMYGQGFTRFNPAFAPKNLIGDTIERGVYISGRDYYNSTTGDLIKGSTQVASFIANLPRAGKAVFSALSGKLDPNSKMGVYWQEYVANGVHQEYTVGRDTVRRTLADAVAEREAAPSFTRRNLEKIPGVKGILDTVTPTLKEQVLNRLDTYNDYFNNAAIFSHFVTLRDAGLSARDAATGALEVLDFHQTGTWTRAISTFFPFVKPSLRTGLNFARTAGLAPDASGNFRINDRGLVTLGATMAAAALLYNVASDSAGTDENGIAYMDTKSIDQLQRSLFIPLGDDGSFFKMPIGFGISQMAMTAVVGGDRLMRGLMTPEDYAANLIFSVVKNVAPGDWPAFSAKSQPLDYLAHLLTPTLLKPMLVDTNFMGRPITNARQDDMKPFAEQGAMRTEAVYHRWAKAVNDQTGIDLAPEQWKNLANQYMQGPFRILTAMWEDDSPAARGERETQREALGPWMYGMGLGIFYDKGYDPARGAYYMARDYYHRALKDAGVSIKSREYGSNVAEREQYQTQQMRNAGFDNDFIQDVLTLERTESAIRSLSSTFNSSTRPLLYSAETLEDLRPNYEQLASDSDKVYVNAVRQLKFLERIGR